MKVVKFEWKTEFPKAPALFYTVWIYDGEEVRMGFWKERKFVSEGDHFDPKRVAAYVPLSDLKPEPPKEQK